MKTTKELEEAVREYQNGNKEVFNRIYELSYPYLYTCVMHVVRDEATAEDMLQETYLEISRNISQLKNAEVFLSWASTIGNRKCYAFLKKHKDVMAGSVVNQDGETQDFLESIADDEAFIPETILQDREKQRLIMEIINGLSDMQRLCIIGFYYSGQSIEEIARDLEIPVNTVKSHLNRAKAKIKDAVIALDQEEGTRLYSIAPFLLLLWAKEAEACETKPMSERLKKELAESGAANSGAVRMMPPLARYKLLAGIALAAVVIGGGALFFYRANTGAGNQMQTESTETETESDVSENLAQEESEPESLPEGQEDVGTLTLDMSEYETFGNAYGGVIPVKKDGLWGAINYRKEEIVPCAYSGYWLTPNLSGYFVLSNDTDGEEIYTLFASDGTKVYEGADTVWASGDFYAVRSMVSNDEPHGEDSKARVDYYDYNGNQVLSTDYLSYSLWNVRIMGAYDGETYLRHQSFKPMTQHGDMKLEGGVLKADGTVQWDPEIYQEDTNDTATSLESMSYTIYSFPIGTPNHGYTIEEPMEAVIGYLYVYTEGHQKALDLYMPDIFFDGNGFVKSSNYDYNWRTWVYDGARFANYGSKMVWVMNGADILVDLALANGSDEGFVGSETIQAVYDYIEPDMTRYWLVQNGEQWGYIDHEGNEMAMYDDASSFFNGSALIVEDGTAFRINENFEIVEEYGDADSVRNYGELWGIIKDDTLTLIYPQQEQ